MKIFKFCRRVGIVAIALLGWASPVIAASTGGACEAAIRRAETTVGMPSGLLLAIGRVEARYGNTVWPWSLNIGGTPVRHRSYNDALVHIQKLRTMGTTNIDVGCLQLNLIWVARGLPVEDVLNPDYNALKAAQHLAKLKQDFGTWTRAVAHYHSYRKTRQTIYVCKVAREYAALLERPLPGKFCS